MPEKKGRIVKIRVKPDVEIKGEKTDMYFVTLEDTQMEYGGKGKCPWKLKDEAHFMYDVNETPERTFLNITSILDMPVQDAVKASEITPDAKIDRLIQAIAGAKVSVSIDKTISERAYEPKKFSVFITVPIGTATSAEIAQKIHELFNMAEVELASRMNGKAKPPEQPNPPEPKSFQESMNSSVPGQKSLIPQPPLPEPKEKRCTCGGLMKKTRIKSGPGLGTIDVWKCEDCEEREPV